MTYVLDIRTLADEWRALLPLLEDADEEDRARCESFEDLCGELGVDATPDALEEYGNDYEPTLIAERDFEEYAQELAEDIGAIPADAGWPAYCIDWQRAARELSVDYVSVRFDGTDFYLRG